MSYGCTLTFNGGHDSYGVSGYWSRESALWAAFRGCAKSLKLEGLTERQRIKRLRSSFMRDTIRDLDVIARAKLGIK